MDPIKVRKMTKIEKFVDKEAAGRLKTARYYRSDYIGLLLIRNFFLVTIGYLLVMAIYLLRNGEAFLEKVYSLNIAQIIYTWIVGYVMVLAAYSALTYLVGSFRFAKAKKMERYLDDQLMKLQRRYEPEDSE